jgi:hypothetical protein
MAVTKIHPIKSTLRQSLVYVLEGKKTNEGLLVSSFACSPQTADIEFSFTLSQCMQKGDNLAFHLIQSFKPGETDQETAHKIGNDLALEFLKGKYEYVLSTHIDKGHIHNHLIFCTANFIDFHKFVSNRKSYYQIRKASDRLCEQYGLSVVIPGEERGKSYKEYLAAKSGTSWKDHLKKAINQSIKYSSSFEEFTLRMNLAGYEVRPGSKLAFRETGQKRFTLSKTLGYGFTEYRICQKISHRIQQPNSAKDPQKLDPLIDLKSSIKAVRSPGYACALTIQNLKTAARTLNLLTEQGSHSFAELEAKHQEIKAAFDLTKVELKALENKVGVLTAIEKHLRIVEKLEDNPGKNKDINVHSVLRASRRYLADHGITDPYPLSNTLATERLSLSEKKIDLYERYYQVKKEWTSISAIRRNVNQMLRSYGKEEPSKD